MNYFIRVVTEKYNGGWRVRIVDTNWIDVVYADWVLCPQELLFVTNCDSVFSSRREARDAVRNYEADRSEYLEVVGGLH